MFLSEENLLTGLTVQMTEDAKDTESQQPHHSNPTAKVKNLGTEIRDRIAPFDQASFVTVVNRKP
jgi:hypothetical protein